MCYNQSDIHQVGGFTVKKLLHPWLVGGGVAALLFITLHILLCTVDVRAIGPLGSSVGLAGANGFVRDRIGASDTLYTLSKLLGILALAAAAAFALLGLWQWITRRSLRRVDGDLFALYAMYAAVLAVYLLYEVISPNYRPVAGDGGLAASFPSSHTLFAVSLFGSSALQLGHRIKNKHLRRAAVLACAICAVATVAFRFLSGVHWLTDILGGMLAGGALLCFYAYAEEQLSHPQSKGAEE